MSIFCWFGILVFVWLCTVRKAIWGFNYFLYRLLTSLSVSTPLTPILDSWTFLGLCGMNSFVLCILHCSYLAISILSLLGQLWFNPSAFHLPNLVDAFQVYPLWLLFVELNCHRKGIWKAVETNACDQSQYLTGILKLNMITQRSI